MGRSYYYNIGLENNDLIQPPISELISNETSYNSNIRHAFFYLTNTEILAIPFVVHNRQSSADRLTIIL